jgi:hypothetical protein
MRRFIRAELSKSAGDGLRIRIPQRGAGLITVGEASPRQHPGCEMPRRN